MGEEQIRTERLILRRVGEEDWRAIRGIWEDQKHSPYACYDRTNDTSPAAVREKIKRWASVRESTEHMFFAVCLDGEMIGFIAFHRRENGYETGYCFHSSQHGKGYASESLGALIRYIRDSGLASHITAGTAVKNLPSVKLLQTVGFRQTGTEQVSFYQDAGGNGIYFEGGIFELDL